MGFSLLINVMIIILMALRKCFYWFELLLKVSDVAHGLLVIIVI